MDAWRQFQRYLVLGTTTSHYRVGGTTGVIGIGTGIHECIRVLAAENRVSDMLNEIMSIDRASSHAIRTLAWIIQHAQSHRLIILWEIMPHVCKTWNDLMIFISCLPRSWGRGTRRAFENWLFQIPPNELAYQMLAARRYRHSMTPRDFLRLVHPRPSAGYDELFAYVSGKWCMTEGNTSYLQDLELARNTTVLLDAIQITTARRLTWEHIGCRQLLSQAALWNVLIDNMSLRDVLQQLSRIVQLTYSTVNTKKICMRLTDHTKILKEKIQPLEVLQAKQQLYMTNGDGDAGDLHHALDEAFRASFGCLRTTTSLRYLIGLDVSGSMACSPCIGSCGLSARDASAVLTMCLLHTEPYVHTLAFSDDLRYLPLHRHQNIEQVLEVISRLSFDDTDCNALIQHAIDQHIIVDCFVIVTDSDLSHKTRLCDSLRNYQTKMNATAKMVIISTSSLNIHSVPQNSRHMMEFGGMDVNVFPALQAFAAGKL